jgi:hypothetical protein
VGVRAEPQRVDVVLALVCDVRLDQILVEDPSLEQEIVIVLQLGEGLVESTRHRRDALYICVSRPRKR